MEIPINLLSTSLRKGWVEVVAHPRLREYGVGRIKLQEIAGDAFDDLWAAVTSADAEVSALELAPTRDLAKVKAAKKAKSEARAALINACVIDHDAATFSAVVPQEDPASEFGKELVETLIRSGFTTEEAHLALSTGKAAKPFNKADCALFYARCQPDHAFETNLLRVIARFQSCAEPSAEQQWVANGALPLAPPPETPK